MRIKNWSRAAVAFVLVSVWLIMGALGGPTFAKLSDISSNDLAAFLPANAESTKVQQLQTKLNSNRTIPAVILFESDKQFSPQELGAYSALGEKLADVEGVEGPTVGPIPAKDFKALQFIVPINMETETDEVIAKLRTIAGQNSSANTTLYVTGPAGVSADLAKAFGGIDGILLIAALSAVFVILLVVYRSFLLPFLALTNAVLALCAAIFVVYFLAKQDIINLTGQSQGILSILVIGAATDYSLLIVARYREALSGTNDRWQAITTGLKRSFEPILASAATVILALFCLLVSDLNSNRSLGPIAATGIVFAFLASLTFLPVVLAIFGDKVFWPSMPKKVKKRQAKIKSGKEDLSGVWKIAARVVAAQPRIIWIVIVVILGVCSLGMLQLKANGVAQTDLILSESNAVDGQKAIARHYSAGVTAPTVVATPKEHTTKTMAFLQQHADVAEVGMYGAGPSAPTRPARVIDGKVLLTATLKADPYSETAQEIVTQLRKDLPKIDEAILVGGTSALSLDTTETAQSDIQKIVPLVLVMIFVVLALLLRALFVPLLLILTVVLSFSATLGISAFVFNHVFHFPGSDAVVPLFAFIFLVALGIDYNIFLITRAREEAFKYGTRPAILHSLGKTGVVITSAGIVLAATFAALGIIPILFLAQIAFIVAFGVLIDTVVVRSLLVPALIYDIGPKVWWPSRKLKK